MLDLSGISKMHGYDMPRMYNIDIIFAHLKTLSKCKEYLAEQKLTYYFENEDDYIFTMYLDDDEDTDIYEDGPIPFVFSAETEEYEEF